MPFFCELTPSAWTQTAASYLSQSRLPGEKIISFRLGMDCAAVQNQSRPPGDGNRQ